MFIPSDTREALHNVQHDNRGLYFDRFADPSLKDEQRQSWFETGCKRPVPAEAGRRIRDSFFPTGTQFIHGQLKARLMVNMAGGVMENAGLCLDRYGVPYIPGSAVKGCARRAALYALREWTQSGNKPDSSDVCHAATHLFSSPETMLQQIALVFGWGETEWTEESSDFLWAFSGNSALLRTTRSLPGIAGLSHRAGTIAFFPAHPNTDPGLELDILTCHHPDYYGDSKSDFAPDTEEPNPVTFPCVRAQTGDDHFTFPVCTIRNHIETALPSAKAWLTLGLEVFGLGAKTAAGYGWFEVAAITQKLDKRRENQRLDEQRKRESEQAKAAELAAKMRTAELERELEGLSGPERQDLLLSKLSEQQFEQKVTDFCKNQNLEEKAAIVRALLKERSKTWDNLKRKAADKPKKFAQTTDAIRALSKTLNIGKMP